MGVPESVPVRAYQCLCRGVSRSRLFFCRGGCSAPDRRNVDRNLRVAIFDSLSVVKSDSVARDRLDVSKNLATAWRSAECNGDRRAVRPILTAWPPTAEPVQSEIRGSLEI